MAELRGCSRGIQLIQSLHVLDGSVRAAQALEHPVLVLVVSQILETESILRVETIVLESQLLLLYLHQKPRMLLDFLQGKSLPRVDVKNLLNEIPCVSRDPGFLNGVVVVTATGDGVEHLLLVSIRVVEGLSAGEHVEEDDAASPDVGDLAIVALLFDDFRSHVVGSAASRVVQVWAVHEEVGDRVLLIGVAEHAQSEVCDLNGSFVNQNVLYLQVSVRDAFDVAELQATDDLTEEHPGFLLLKEVFLLENLEQVSAWDKLHDEEDLGP